MTVSDRASSLVAHLDVVLATLTPAPARPLYGAKRRRRPSAADQRYVLALDRIRRRTEPAFAAELRTAFGKLGPIVASAYAAAKQRKDDDDELDVVISRTMRGVNLAAYRDRMLRKPYERHYSTVAKLTTGAVEQRAGVELGVNLVDVIGREVIKAGGKRVGLVDLDGDTRSALFRALHQTRVDGLGPADAAKLITQYVPAGRFAGQGIEAGSLYRSTMIARTETRYAQGISAIEAGKGAGLRRFVVFDARIGETDAECMALDGSIVDADEAERLMQDEHPNGTRSISPLPSDATDAPSSPAPSAPSPRPRPAPAVAPAPAPVALPTARPARVTPRTIAAPDAPLSPAARKTVDAYETAHRNDPVESGGVIAQDGTLLLDKSQGKRASVGFSDPEVALMKDAIITHNHPRGSAFSLPDYYMLRNANAYELRVARNVVVGRERNYGGGSMTARLTDESRAMTPLAFRRRMAKLDREVATEMQRRAGVDLTYEAASYLHYDVVADRAQTAGLLIIRREQS